MKSMHHYDRRKQTNVRISETFRAFRNKNYQLLWSANILAYSSRWGQLILLGWFVLELTDSAFRVALVGVFGTAPMLMLGLFGGMLADLVDRRRLLLGVHVLTLTSALIMTSVLWSGYEDFRLAYVVIFISGIGWALDMPSRRSLIHDLIGNRGVTNAIALDSVGMSASMMVGPSLAGIFISLVGVKGSYTGVVLLYLISILLLYRMEISKGAIARSDSWHVINSLVEGLRYVMRHRAILATVFITLVMNILMYPYTHLVPVIARDVLNVGPVHMGFLQSAAGFGATAGAVLVASQINIRYHGRIFLGGAVVSSIFLLLFSFSTWYSASFTILLLLGVGTSGFSTMQTSIVMLLADQKIRGKALGVISLAIGTSPFGAFMLGIMAENLSVQFAIKTNAILALGCLVMIGIWTPDLLRPVRTD